MLTYWLAQIPDGPPQAPPGLDGFFNSVVGWAKGIVIFLGVLGIIICGAMMIMGRRNRSSLAVDGASGIPWVLGGLFLASIAATIVGSVI